MPPSGGPFVADAVDRRDEDAVGDRVDALHRLPGVVLRRAELGLLLRVPADGRRDRRGSPRPAAP